METIQSTGNDINIKVNDITINYDDFGTGTIPIIFIHGFPFNKSSWQPQIEFLKTTHRVIAYDIRGFGKSTRGEEAAEITLFASDLIHFMDSLQISKAIVCGLSMGGYILLDAVLRFPERFEAIILCDTQCTGDSPEAKEKRTSNISHIKSDGLNEYADGSVKNLFCPETLESNKPLVEKIRNVIQSTASLSIIATLKALANRNDVCSSLYKITLPTLILCGKEDVITPPARAEQLKNNIAKAKLQIIEKAGHLANLEQALEFNTHLKNFISDHQKVE